LPPDEPSYNGGSTPIFLYGELADLSLLQALLSTSPSSTGGALFISNAHRSTKLIPAQLPFYKLRSAPLSSSSSESSSSSPYSQQHHSHGHPPPIPAYGMIASAILSSPSSPSSFVTGYLFNGNEDERALIQWFYERRHLFGRPESSTQSQSQAYLYRLERVEVLLMDGSSKFAIADSFVWSGTDPNLLRREWDRDMFSVEVPRFVREMKGGVLSKVHRDSRGKSGGNAGVGGVFKKMFGLGDKKDEESLPVIHQDAGWRPEGKSL
jgi:hypothetical protein